MADRSTDIRRSRGQRRFKRQRKNGMIKKKIKMIYKKMKPNELNRVIDLAVQLWPECTKSELKQILRDLVKAKNGAVVVCKNDDDRIIAFATLSIRSDYVEGSNSSPVGYLEGIYVEKTFRRKKIGKGFVKYGEAWSKRKGCREFASDAQLSNKSSYRFHIGTGFRAANKIICFIKKIR
jgi:aminoglycoside 6'-N-acetyltransferase I